jgi:putative ABC transport system permease protein
MQSFLMAMKAITGNKMRSFLTMLGIMIGVLSIVVLVAIAQGATSAVVSRVENMGTNLLTVNIRARRNNPVTLKKLIELSGEDGIAYVAPILTGSGTIKAGLIQYADGNFIGTTPGFNKIRNWTVRTGRFITPPDIDNRNFIAVIGEEVATELFGTINAVDQTFTFNGYTFTVVGVLDTVGESVSGSGDNMIILPFSLAERLFNLKGITRFYVSAESSGLVETAQAAITSYMDKLIKSGSSSSTYTIYNQTAMLETLSATTGMLTLMLGGIAAISLLVGGIGIMNIMLVSVTERTREIGIRKAIGATRFNILSQFLIEALVISVLGGVIGLLLSILVVQALTPILSMELTVSPVITAIAIGFSMFIGIVFGIYPANKASKLYPVEALRYE